MTTAIQTNATYSNTLIDPQLKSPGNNWWYHNDYIEGLDEELIMVEAETPPNIEQFSKSYSEQEGSRIQGINLDEFVTTAMPAVAGVMAVRSIATTLALSFPLVSGAAAIGAFAAHAIFEERQESMLKSKEEYLATAEDLTEEMIVEDAAYLMPEDNLIIH